MRISDVPTQEALRDLLRTGKDVEEIIYQSLKNKCPPDELIESVDWLYGYYVWLLEIVDDESAVEEVIRQINNKSLI